jgi:hypothetical protein
VLVLSGGRRIGDDEVKVGSPKPCWGTRELKHPGLTDVENEVQARLKRVVEGM